MLDLIDHASDIMAYNTGQKITLQTSPSKENVLQEQANLIKPTKSYKKSRPSLTKMIRLPPSGSKKKH